MMICHHSSSLKHMLDRSHNGRHLTHQRFFECLTILASLSLSCTRTMGVLLYAIATLLDVLNDTNALSTNNMIHHGGYDESDKEGESSFNPILSTLQVEDPTLLIPCLDIIKSLQLTSNQIAELTRARLG